MAWTPSPSVRISASCRTGKTRLILYIATGFLTENKLDPRSLLSMLISKSGVRFLANRREEILGIFVSRKVYADYHKD